MLLCPLLPECTAEPNNSHIPIQSSVRSSGVPGIFFGGGGGGGCQQIQLRTEGRENRDLGAVAPQSRVPLNLQMSEARILIRLLRMYFPRDWGFGSALSKLRNFGARGC
jgi:hypothetical protein